MGDKVQPLRCRALTRLAGATSPDARALQVPFKGVSFCFRVTTPIFEAKLSAGGACTSLGYFATDVQAACAYDDAVRSAGRRVVNFPRPGTDEVQAVRDETERATLKRLVAEKAGAEGGTTSRGISPLPKRHAVAAPPSEPPRKRAAARFEAQVKPELAAPVVSGAVHASPAALQQSGRAGGVGWSVIRGRCGRSWCQGGVACGLSVVASGPRRRGGSARSAAMANDGYEARRPEAVIHVGDGQTTDVQSACCGGLAAPTQLVRCPKHAQRISAGTHTARL